MSMSSVCRNRCWKTETKKRYTSFVGLNQRRSSGVRTTGVAILGLLVVARRRLPAFVCVKQWEASVEHRVLLFLATVRLLPSCVCLLLMWGIVLLFLSLVQSRSSVCAMCQLIRSFLAQKRRRQSVCFASKMQSGRMETIVLGHGCRYSAAGSGRRRRALCYARNCDVRRQGKRGHTGGLDPQVQRVKSCPNMGRGAEVR